MHKKIYQVDSFTDTPFKGNPAGVVILTDDAKTEWMQNLAMEMNLSETAFIQPKEDYYSIRYFTPTQEVVLCGHATLASAHILYETGKQKCSESIIFRAAEHQLEIFKIDNWIEMSFPAYRLDAIACPDNFSGIVGFTPKEIYRSDYGWVMAVAHCENDIINAAPQFQLLKDKDYSHLMITARKDGLSDADFIVRCFAPSAGINEDPVTGSAHCALAPYWTQKLGKNKLVSEQISKRGGTLHLQLINNKVLIRGKAKTVFQADLFV